MTKKHLTPHEALKRYWGYEDFRNHQLPAVEACLDGRDGLLVLHTSGGKSLCFQVPAVIMDGTAVVISPLISLMKDQVDALNKKGIPATFINSSISAEESLARETGLRDGKYKLVYCAPERLDNPAFRDLIAQSNVSFFAIDESHCVSTWGHDFRLAYRRIPKYLDEIGRLREKRIPRFAYTATATPEIRTDIMRQLDMVNPYHDVGSFDRDNIAFTVQASKFKNQDVLDLVAQHKGECTIVYSATVRVTEDLAARLRNNGISAAAYHGRLSSEEKERVQNGFLNDEIQVIVATNAFGMGVDKPDVRNVIHYHMPGNLEAYYQEAGRAGRDGKESNAYLLYSKRDRGLQEFLIDMSYPRQDFIWEVFYSLYAYSSGASFYLSEKEIAGICRVDIDSKYISSILRILEDKEFIELDKNPETHAYTGINIIANPGDEMDLSFLNERRQHVMSNLNSMEMFCQTTLCRRRFVLKHFGEKTDYDGCGYCDNCLSRGLSSKTGDLYLPIPVVKSAMEAISALGKKHGAKVIVEALIGTQTQMLRRRKIHELSFFSSLHAWTARDVEILALWLVHEGYATMPNKLASISGIKLTPRGEDWLHSNTPKAISCPAKLKHRAHNSFSSGINKREIGAVVEANTGGASGVSERLRKLRMDLSRELGKPAFMIFSDQTIHRISSNPPGTLGDLHEMGISTDKTKAFGQKILDACQNRPALKPDPFQSIPDIPI